HRWIDEGREHFLNDSAFLASLIASPQGDTREFARTLLLSATLAGETAQARTRCRPRPARSPAARSAGAGRSDPAQPRDPGGRTAGNDYSLADRFASRINARHRAATVRPAA